MNFPYFTRYSVVQWKRKEVACSLKGFRKENRLASSIFIPRPKCFTHIFNLASFALLTGLDHTLKFERGIVVNIFTVEKEILSWNLFSTSPSSNKAYILLLIYYANRKFIAASVSKKYFIRTNRNIAVNLLPYLIAVE